MLRRDFLKILAAAPAAAYIPVTESSLIETQPEIRASGGGYVRMVSSYDLIWDHTIYRADILTGDKQHGVDFRLPREATKAEFDRAMQLAMEPLAKTARNKHLVKWNTKYYGNEFIGWGDEYFVKAMKTAI